MAISAAIGILSQQGIGGLSTRKVAAEIGYTAGTLYLVFKNLDELILHVNAATLDEIHAQIASELDRQVSPQQMIKNMAMSYMQYARENYARWSLLFSHTLPDGTEAPRWLDIKVATLFELVERPIRTMLPDLESTECMRAIRVLWSSVHGACELGLNGKLTLGGRVQAEELVESLVDNYLNGLLHH